MFNFLLILLEMMHNKMEFDLKPYEIPEYKPNFRFDARLKISNNSELSLKKENLRNLYKNRESYYACMLEIKNSEILNCTGFGSFHESGFGGGICVVVCQVLLFRCNFSCDIAAFGGTICAKFSVMLIQESNFELNNALKSGGAIYIDNEDNNDIYLINSKILNNFAENCGGGIFINKADSIYIENIEFIDNVAQISGGGIYALDTNHMMLNECDFIRNHLMRINGHENSVYFSNASYVRKFMSKPLLYRGGGAMYINGSHENSLAIYSCNFKNNYCSNISTVPSNALLATGIQVKIMHGYIQSPFNENYYINGSNYYYANLSYNTGDNMSVYPSSSNYASPNAGINYSITTYVPEPTNYTHITKPQLYNQRSRLTQNIQFERPTQHRTRSRVDTVTPIPIEKGWTKSSTISKTNTTFITLHTTKIWTNSLTEKFGSVIYIYTEIVSDYEVLVNGELDIVIYFDIKLPETTNEPNSSRNHGNIITIFVCAFVAVYIIIMIAFIIHKYVSKQEDETDNSPSSSLEMAEETVKNINLGSVTVDNPLWTTSVADENHQDPFHNDFESDVQIRYFYASESERSNEENESIFENL